MTGPIEPAALAADLIRCESVTPRDEGALGVLAKALEGLGFTCHPLEFTEPGTDPVKNLYARLGADCPNFCYAGHTDVVPPGNLKSWSIDPFAAEIHDGYLYGRGAVDMKGGIASFVTATDRFLRARNGKFKGSISLLITGDEEGVNINGTRKVLDWLEARGETLDACIVGEPTNAKSLGDMMKIGRRGSLTGHLTVHGISGHAAYPHLADNAAHRIVRMLHALTSEPLDEGTAHFQASSLQVSTVDVGNPTTNVIPAEAKASFNVRFNDLWTSETLQAWIEERLEREGGRWDLAVRVSGESFLVPPGQVSDLLTEAIGQVTGETPDLSTTGGTSDARFIHRFCPLAEFGLVGLTMHKVDERVALKDLENLAEIYRIFLDRYFA